MGLDLNLTLSFGNSKRLGYENLSWINSTGTQNSVILKVGEDEAIDRFGERLAHEACKG